MAIPKSDTVMLPLLRLAAGGEFRNADAIESLASEFRLTPEDRTQVLRNGQSKFANLVYWASGQLKTAKLLNKSLGGEYEITERGRTVLANPPEVIDRRFLAQFPEYRQLNGEKVTVQSESGEIEVEVRIGKKCLLQRSPNRTKTSDNPSECRRELQNSALYLVSVFGFRPGTEVEFLTPFRGTKGKGLLGHFQ
jgi:restriction endonuclease Mrr